MVFRFVYTTVFSSPRESEIAFINPLYMVEIFYDVLRAVDRFLINFSIQTNTHVL